VIDNYFQKFFTSRNKLKRRRLTHKAIHSNPHLTPEFLDTSCYCPIREWFYIGTAPDQFFLAREAS
jgi:hypothetical protein